MLVEGFSIRLICGKGSTTLKAPRLDSISEPLDSEGVLSVTDSFSSSN